MGRGQAWQRGKLTDGNLLTWYLWRLASPDWLGPEWAISPPLSPHLENRAASCSDFPAGAVLRIAENKGHGNVLQT